MPKGKITHPHKYGKKPTESQNRGHPMKYDETVTPICGASLVDLEARLNLIKPKESN